MKKFWQNLIVWQKASIFVFLFLSLVFIMVFLGASEYSKQCLRSFRNNIKTQKEDVEIYTDKIVYNKDESVVITFKNNLGSEIFPHPFPQNTSIHKYFGESYGMGMIEKFENNNWEPIEPLWRCGNACFHECRYKSSLDALETKIFEWDQTIIICDKYNRTEETKLAELGRYRVSSYVWLNKEGDYKQIYSNEFTINNSKQEGLFIKTDKTQYRQGEKIMGKIQNNLNKKVSFYFISIVESTEVILEDTGDVFDKKVRYDIECPCSAKCSRVPTALAPGSYRNFSGDLKNHYCENIPAGKYKISVNWQAENESGYSYSDEFEIIDSNLTEECAKDSDCEAEFSNCDCKYHCLNKNNEEEEFEDCDNECKMILHPKPECVCSNNKCVEASNCDKLKLEINDLIDKIKYCEKDSDCELDESYDDTIWPFDCFLIKNKLYGEDYRNLIQEKTNEYLDNDCPYYPLRECPYPPKPEDIKCQNNQCVDARFSSFKESGAQESESIVERLNRLNAQGELTAEDQGWEIEQKCYGLESINDCEKINWPMKCGCRTDGKHECYRCFAELLKNADYCGKIEEEFWMNNCYWAVAVQLRDAGEQDKINFCGKMTGEARSDNQKGACFEIAKEKKLKIDQK